MTLSVPRYADTLKLLPEMPEPICIDQVIAQVAELGRINRPVHPV